MVGLPWGGAGPTAAQGLRPTSEDRGPLLVAPGDSPAKATTRWHRLPGAHRPSRYYSYAPTGYYTIASRAQPASEVAAHRPWQPPIPAAGALALAAGIGGYLWLGRRRQQQAFRQLRSRLADDLHDELGALLVRASFQAEALKCKQPVPLAAANQLLASIQEASRAMRDIAWGIDPNANTLGSLLDRMQEYVDQLPATGRCQVKITDSGIANEQAIVAAARQHIYYIFKEAVANALRHASSCALLTISLQQRGHNLVLQVANDGARVVAPRPGMGMRSMSRRAREVGGHLEATPRALGGFQVLLTVPFQGTGLIACWKTCGRISWRRSSLAKAAQALVL